MSDYGEIVSTLARIQHSVDHQNLEGFRDGWTSDTQLHLTMFDGNAQTIKGRDELISRFASNWTGQASALRHVVGAVEVKLLGPSAATADFYCTYVTVGAEPAMTGVGEYHDDLVKEADGRWRVKVRRHSFLTPLAIRGH